MISTMTGSINREVTPCQERLKASADCWLSRAAAPTFPIMALLTGAAIRRHEQPAQDADAMAFWLKAGKPHDGVGSRHR